MSRGMLLHSSAHEVVDNRANNEKKNIFEFLPHRYSEHEDIAQCISSNTEKILYYTMTVQYHFISTFVE